MSNDDNVDEMDRESDVILGKEESPEIRAKVIRYEADLFNAAMMMQVIPHPLNPTQGQPLGIATGGLSKRQGVAMNLFSACLKVCDEDEEQAVEMAYYCADLLLEGTKKYPKEFKPSWIAEREPRRVG